MHRIHQAQTLLHESYFAQAFDRIADVHKPAPIHHLKPSFFGQICPESPLLRFTFYVFGFGPHA
jgi:hypothetical protein